MVRPDRDRTRRSRGTGTTESHGGPPLRPRSGMQRGSELEPARPLVNAGAGVPHTHRSALGGDAQCDLGTRWMSKARLGQRPIAYEGEPGAAAVCARPRATGLVGDRWSSRVTCWPGYCGLAGTPSCLIGRVKLDSQIPSVTCGVGRSEETPRIGKATRQFNLSLF